MPPSPLHQHKLRQAHALQVQGQFGQAADLYRAVLAEDPGNAPALHLLGLLVMQAGQVESGLEMVRKSLGIMPGFAPAYESLGKGLEKLGRQEEALAAYDRLVRLAPSHGEGYGHRARVLESMARYTEALREFDKALSLKPDSGLMLNRGSVLMQLQRPKEALAAFDKAIKAGLTHHAVHFNRGVALTALGRLEDALAAYDEALMRDPDYAEGLINRGLVLESLQRQDEALLSYDRALTLKPDSPEGVANRTALLLRMGRRDEAMANLDEQIARDPGDAEAYNQRGAVLKAQGELESALADFDRALALRPDDALVISNRALALQSLARFDEALADLDRALARDPSNDDLHFNRGGLQLLLGNFAEGWHGHEKRPRTMGPAGLDPAKLWQGPSQSVAGKTVLIHAEQGMGDAIHFSRYLIDLHALGAKLVFAERDHLVRLMRTLPVPVTFISENTAPAALDFHAPLMSLPAMFGTTAQTIPSHVPYLAAEAERVAQWRERLGSHGFRIAISWQGKIRGANDPFRAFPLDALAPLAALPGVRLISVQKGEGSEQLNTLPAGMAVERLGEDFDAGFDAFIDTAAVMEACDLVISCDTSIAHLAGALGRPVWTALKHVPEWRWQLGRSDSPWYPTMTLYRQPGPDDWESVVADMARDLKPKLA